MKDPYVAEVRKHRMEHTQRFGSDLHRFCENVREFEASLGTRVVTLRAKKRRPTRPPG